MKVTCLIPTYNNGAMITAAIESALAQAHTDLELFIVCDGAPEVTHQIADRFAAQDARARVFKFDKGERHGEALRHQALQEATGEAVCYLSDDDCWFPDHLQVMSELLSRADFAHTRHTYIKPKFEFACIPLQITDAGVREHMCKPDEKFNIMGLSVAGHRLDAYRQLPEGWAPAPKETPTDLNMWRKWIAAGARFAASGTTTALHIPRSTRTQQDQEASLLEANYWRITFRDPAMREALQEALAGEVISAPAGQIARRANEMRRARG